MDQSAAWAEALAENATDVWKAMIGVWEGVLTAVGIPKQEAPRLRYSKNRFITIHALTCTSCCVIADNSK
jgi:hypothetical protein